MLEGQDWEFRKSRGLCGTDVVDVRCWAWSVMIFGLPFWANQSVHESAPLQCFGYNKPIIRVMCEPQSPP